MTFTATVTANAPGSGTPTGTVDFYDTTTSTDLTPGGVALSSGTATFSTTSLAAGSHTIKATYSGDGNFLTSNGTRRHGHDRPVDHRPRPVGRRSPQPLGQCEHQHLPAASSSIPARRRALSASGNAPIKASVIDVHGGVQKSGNASFSPAPTTGAAVARRSARLAGRAEHLGPDQLRLREPERELVRDDQAGHLQPDQRLGQRQADPE